MGKKKKNLPILKRPANSNENGGKRDIVAGMSSKVQTKMATNSESEMVNEQQGFVRDDLGNKKVQETRPNDHDLAVNGKVVEPKVTGNLISPQALVHEPIEGIECSDTDEEDETKKMNYKSAPMDMILSKPIFDELAGKTMNSGDVGSSNSESNMDVGVYRNDQGDVGHKIMQLLAPNNVEIDSSKVEKMMPYAAGKPRNTANLGEKITPDSESGFGHAIYGNVRETTRIMDLQSLVTNNKQIERNLMANIECEMAGKSCNSGESQTSNSSTDWVEVLQGNDQESKGSLDTRFAATSQAVSRPNVSGEDGELAGDVQASSSSNLECQNQNEHLIGDAKTVENMDLQQVTTLCKNLSGAGIAISPECQNLVDFELALEKTLLQQVLEGATKAIHQKFNEINNITTPIDDQDSNDQEIDEDESSSIDMRGLNRLQRFVAITRRNEAAKVKKGAEMKKLGADLETVSRGSNSPGLQPQLDRVGDLAKNAAAPHVQLDRVITNPERATTQLGRVTSNSGRVRGSEYGEIGQLEMEMQGTGRAGGPSGVSKGVVEELVKTQTPTTVVYKGLAQVPHGEGQLDRVTPQADRVERPASVIVGTAVGNQKDATKTPKVPTNVSYKAALLNEEEGPSTSKFKKNRNWNRGSKLELIVDASDEVFIADHEVPNVEKTWGFSLLGYIAGEDIGRGAIISCCNSWKVGYKAEFDDSGWIVIKFDNAEDRDKVMENGPYVVFSRPFILKPIPQLFDFGDDSITKVPVWVKFPRLPLDLWEDNILSRIGSKIGTPLRTDEMTASRERKSYARIFVEVDVSKELKKEITLKFSKGKVIKQRVIYEFVPLFCKTCKAIGHSDATCGLNNKNRGQYQMYKAKTPLNQKDAGVVGKGKEALVETLGVVRGLIEVVPNQSTNAPSLVKGGVTLSTPVVEARGNGRTQNPKQVEASRPSVVEVVPNHQSAASSSRQVAQSKGGVSQRYRVVGDHATREAQALRKGKGRLEDSNLGVVEQNQDKMQRIMDFLITNLSPDANATLVDGVTNLGIIEEDKGEWEEPKSKKNRRNKKKKGGNPPTSK